MAGSITAADEVVHLERASLVETLGDVVAVQGRRDHVAVGAGGESEELLLLRIECSAKEWLDLGFQISIDIGGRGRGIRIALAAAKAAPGLTKVAAGPTPSGAAQPSRSAGRPAAADARRSSTSRHQPARDPSRLAVHPEGAE